MLVVVIVAAAIIHTYVFIMNEDRCFPVLYERVVGFVGVNAVLSD